MKETKKVMTMGLILLITIFSAQAQQRDVNVKTIEPHKLQVTSSKTTNIIFPHAIISVDRGSKDVLAQKAKGVENILQVKAAKDTFAETNLTVVTADGKLNSFIVSYAKYPAVLNVSLVANTYRNDKIFLSPENINEAEVKNYAQAAIGSKKNMWGIEGKSYGIHLQLTGIFVHDDVLYIRVGINNQSNINYEIDQLRFYIRDEKKAKRTATQEIEVSPIYVESPVEKVAGKGSDVIVFALPKFTIPDKKLFVAQLMEKNGGRHIELRIKNQNILNAKVLAAGPGEVNIEQFIKF